jgi:hypothetical protein
MKKESAKASYGPRREDDLRQLKGGVRGKYYRRAIGGTNPALIEPDLARVFPDSHAVNRALRIIADAAQAAIPRRAKRHGADKAS